MISAEARSDATKRPKCGSSRRGEPLRDLQHDRHLLDARVARQRALQRRVHADDHRVAGAFDAQLRARGGGFRFRLVVAAADRVQLDGEVAARLADHGQLVGA
jgi:hypothetical protein